MRLRLLAPARVDVGARVRQLRIDRGLTQQQLADRAALSKEAVWTIEAGRKRPRSSTVALLAAALGVAPCELADQTIGAAGSGPGRTVPTIHLAQSRRIAAC